VLQAEAAAIRIARELRAVDGRRQRRPRPWTHPQRILVGGELHHVGCAEPALQLLDRHSRRVGLQREDALGGVAGELWHQTTARGYEPSTLKNAALPRTASSALR